MKWVGYLSSTGIYAELKGDRINEQAPIHCTNKKSLIRYEAECSWKDLYDKYQIPVHIFRLSGIYGPERNAFTLLLQQQQNTVSPMTIDNETISSRIHVDDIIQILQVSMGNPTPGEVFNVADDHPSSKYEVKNKVLNNTEYLSS